MRRIFGLTGSMGCGKSEVSKILRDEGFQIFDCDGIAKSIVVGKEFRKKIISILGTNEPFLEKVPNTKLIAKIIFSDREIKTELEEFVHPLVWKFICHHMSLLSDNAMVFVESALVFETGWHTKFEKTIVVTCDDKIQIQRLMEHRNFSLDEIRNRVCHQMFKQEKESLADVIIVNDGTKEDLEGKVLKLIKQLTEGDPK